MIFIFRGININRLYVLISVQSGTAEKVCARLRSSSGVVLADIIENPVDIIMVIEAADRCDLAKYIINALSPVENLIEGLQIMPTPNKKLKREVALACCCN